MLGNDVFSLFELEFPRIQIYGLRSFADQSHLYSAMDFVVGGMMPERRKIEVSSQFAIGPGQNADIELCRDSFAVIIRRLQDPPGLFSVNADQQTSAPPAKLGDVSQKSDRR